MPLPGTSGPSNWLAKYVAMAKAESDKLEAAKKKAQHVCRRLRGRSSRAASTTTRGSNRDHAISLPARRSFPKQLAVSGSDRETFESLLLLLGAVSTVNNFETRPTGISLPPSQSGGRAPQMSPAVEIKKLASCVHIFGCASGPEGPRLHPHSSPLVVAKLPMQSGVLVGQQPYPLVQAATFGEKVDAIVEALSFNKLLCKSVMESVELQARVAANPASELVKKNGNMRTNKRKGDLLSEVAQKNGTATKATTKGKRAADHDKNDQENPLAVGLTSRMNRAHCPPASLSTSPKKSAVELTVVPGVESTQAACAPAPDSADWLSPRSGREGREPCWIAELLR
ncbi:hypothetical protein KVR01_012033 [Diaporthe batatas]|uniref:uncharacterized protein n=1 Tax=Diaporthe batatas TaxID=748121 RepID=UPI001D04213A|nr:uncharacterized protein KVR01_012033 [Diaporthe batatas]KAG8158272.1 hypothetical protein KVR01_012033 [Diaporthe batatas]